MLDHLQITAFGLFKFARIFLHACSRQKPQEILFHALFSRYLAYCAKFFFVVISVCSLSHCICHIDVVMYRVVDSRSISCHRLISILWCTHLIHMIIAYWAMFITQHGFHLYISFAFSRCQYSSPFLAQTMEILDCIIHPAGLSQVIGPTRHPSTGINAKHEMNANPLCWLRHISSLIIDPCLTLFNMPSDALWRGFAIQSMFLTDVVVEY
mmetsp:Transcript_45578/g.72925  ORF Transcript_45578/g.72925 Transcript_45578/m.72925 type:complete len:211 (-) Transcript_45578:461-1093(-)